jgi:hypothetical protein
MSTDILWDVSALEGGAMRSPSSILIEHAKPVAKLTKGDLRAEVRAVRTRSKESSQLSLTLYLTSEHLPTYRYEVVKVRYAEDYPYPCVVISEETVDSYQLPLEVSTEADLLNALKRVMSSPRVNAAISSMRVRINELRSHSQPLVIDDEIEEIDLTPEPAKGSDNSVPF